MGVEGRDASLDLWMGTFTGREVASKKSFIRFLLMISECMGRNSGLEEDRDDLLLDEADDDDDWLVLRCLIERSNKSHIVMSR